LLAAGGAILVPSIMLLLLLAWGVAKGVDWRSYQPLWSLLHEARSSDPVTRDPAMREIFTRLVAGKTSAAAVAPLIEDALRLQARPDEGWPPIWGDFVEQTRLRGFVSDAQWERYAEQAAVSCLHPYLRRRIRQGDPLPYAIDYTGARVGNSA